jgi:RNA polymerase sigma-70 factor, ECF subfamily
MSSSEEPNSPSQQDGSGSGPENLNDLRNAIRAFVLSQVRNPALADDLTQETLLRLHKRLHTLRNPERLHAWVFQIARNAVADHFRAAREIEPFDELAHTPDSEPQLHAMLAAEEDLLRGALGAYVRSVVEGLPEIYREALRLTEFEGVSQVELAARVGLSVSAAKSRVQRARAMVRSEMERCCRWEADRYGAIVDVQPKSPDGCNAPGEQNSRTEAESSGAPKSSDCCNAPGEGS